MSGGPASGGPASGGPASGGPASGGRAGRARSWRLRGLLAVIAVMAALAGGWTLVNAAISGTVPLPDGDTLTVGSQDGPPFQVTVGPGWSEHLAAGDCVLTRAGTSLTIDPVTIVGSHSVTQIWSDLGRVAQIGNAGARLGPPGLIRSRPGLAGLIGRLSVPGRPAVAALFPGPGGAYVIEIIAIGRPGSSADTLAAAVRVIKSVGFPGSSR